MRVTLNTDNHTYKDEQGQFFKSVSSIISQYKHPFNPHKKMPNRQTLIQNYVEKNGESEQYWLDVWEAKKDYACNKGTAFHDLKELVVNSQSVQRTGKFELPVQNLEFQWQLPRYEGRIDLLWPGMYTELIIWNYMVPYCRQA